MMFALARQLPEADASTQAGKWEKNRFMGVEVTSKVLGLIGCGNIGSIVADRAIGLKMRVIAYYPYLTEKRALDLGFMLGLGGVLTYKNGLIDTFIHELPKDRIVLETDAPFLSPVPHRGKRNEPAFMLSVAETLSVLWNTSLDETARITTANARRLFRLAP
jgi:hypothetical protein